ncbi:MAG: hypothetical protein K0S74_1078 [Chlamydiales bacterium]|jgi:hypothetical protein|nr:hypothetical protein [Chlamydiales bacterium]
MNTLDGFNLGKIDKANFMLDLVERATHIPLRQALACLICLTGIILNREYIPKDDFFIIQRFLRIAGATFSNQNHYNIFVEHFFRLYPFNSLSSMKLVAEHITLANLQGGIAQKLFEKAVSLKQIQEAVDTFKSFKEYFPISSSDFVKNLYLKGEWELYKQFLSSSCLTKQEIKQIYKKICAHYIELAETEPNTNYDPALSFVLELDDPITQSYLLWLICESLIRAENYLDTQLIVNVIPIEESQQAAQKILDDIQQNGIPKNKSGRKYIPAPFDYKGKVHKKRKS